MHHAGVAVSAELVRTAVDRQSFFKFREHNESAYRRLGCSDQKPVVSACIASIDSARRKPANSVGLQPFAAKCGVEVLRQTSSPKRIMTQTPEKQEPDASRASFPRHPCAR